MTQAPASVEISKAQIRRRAGEFASRWADATSESAEKQTFWNEFFAVFGIERRQVAAFEQIAERASTGGKGFIDVLFPGQMAVEHKSAQKDLDVAMEQAVDYLPALTKAEHPWLVVVCDFECFKWRNLDSGASGEFSLADLASNLHLFWWMAGHGKPGETFANAEDVNLKATALMAALHDELRAAGYDEHALREWMTRVLFCLFADDTDVWDRAAFHAYIARNTRIDGHDLGPVLAHIFQVLNEPEDKRQTNLDEDLAQFTYINGDLFENTLPIPATTAATRAALLEACKFDWAKISPAIFGSMFQNVMEPAERRQLGAHYTTEQNILRTIRPLFLDDLEAELAAATSRRKLLAFHDKLAALKLFDPACGCGNFLVIAYREIRRLETEVLRRLAQTQQSGARRTRQVAGQRAVSLDLLCKVRVDQFYGIEIEEFPSRIARTAMYLIDHIANREVSAEFGELYIRFPIPASPHIVQGNALRLDWKGVVHSGDVDYVFGNPPFVGHALTTPDQQADNRQVFTNIGATGLRTGRLDYVAGWYAKAFEYAKDTPIRLAFVSTNSITQGEQARTLGPLLQRYGFGVDFGHRTFAWTSEARGTAHVHVVIVGFSHGPQAKTKRLFDYPDIKKGPIESAPTRLNWYLADGPDVYPGKRRDPLVPGLPNATKGSQPTDGGHLIVTAAEYDDVERDQIARKYLRRFVQGSDLLSGEERWCLWLVTAPPNDLRSSPVLRRRLREVAEARRASATESVQAAASTPALFTQRRQPAVEYLAMPEVSSARRQYIPAAYLAPDTIAGNKLITFPAAPLWVFGVLQSSMYMAWVRTVVGRLKSDYSISPSLAYFTFPFPSPSNAGRQRVERAAQKVLDTRKSHSTSSLSDLYDPLAMPADLLRAHTDLDRAVDSLYRRRRFKGDADRLADLFTSYVALANPLQTPTT